MPTLFVSVLLTTGCILRNFLVGTRVGHCLARLDNNDVFRMASIKKFMIHVRRLE